MTFNLPATKEEWEQRHSASMDALKDSTDYLEWCTEHNKHTLTISLVDEQRPLEYQYFDPKQITFFNQDNSISHLAILEDFLDLLTQDENKGWGIKSQTNEELVDRILDPIRDRLLGIVAAGDDDGIRED